MVVVAPAKLDPLHRHLEEVPKGEAVPKQIASR